MKDVKSKKPLILLLLDDLEIPHTTHLNVFLFLLNLETHTQTSSGSKFDHTKYPKAVDQGRRIQDKYAQFDLHAGSN